MVMAPLEIATMVSLIVVTSLILMPGVNAGFLNISFAKVERFRCCCRCVMNSGVVVQPGGEDRSTAARGRERQW